MHSAASLYTLLMPPPLGVGLKCMFCTSHIHWNTLLKIDLRVKCSRVHWQKPHRSCTEATLTQNAYLNAISCVWDSRQNQCLNVSTALSSLEAAEKPIWFGNRYQKTKVSNGFPSIAYFLFKTYFRGSFGQHIGNQKDWILLGMSLTKKKVFLRNQSFFLYFFLFIVILLS